LKSKDKHEIVVQGLVRGRHGFLPYCLTIEDDPDYEISWHHKLIGWRLEKALSQVLKGEKVRLIITVPPRHGKSDEVTVKFPTWALGVDPNLEIITSSYNSELATDFGQKARDVVSNEEYQRLFNTRLRPDTTAKSKWLTMTTNEEGKLVPARGGYTSVGIGGSITGRGFNIGIIDDPIKNREEAESEVFREKIWNWYRSTFYTRQTKGYGAIIIIITRWHEDDLVGRLLEKQEADKKAGKEDYDKWEVINFPAIAEKNEEFRNKGEALWPSFYPLGILKNIENTLGIYEWSALYQQTPISSEFMEFKKSYFRYWEYTNIRRKRFQIDITIDPAISKKKEACDTAIVAKGKTEDEPEWYILDYIVGKLDPGAIFKATAKMYNELERNYPNVSINVWIETIGYQEALRYIFDEEMKKINQYFNVYEYRDSADKQTRIRGLIPLYKMGLVYHRPGMPELEKELMAFPKGKTVDLPDALAFHLKLTKPTDRKERRYKPPPPKPVSRYAGTQPRSPQAGRSAKARPRRDLYARQ